MGFLSRFEGRMEDTFEGAADKMFDAPISPVQIAKKAEKQMRREKMVGAGKQYAPTLYTVLVNPDDDRRLMGYYPTLAGETETYLTAKASEQGLVMDGQPLVRFIVDDPLRALDVLVDMGAAATTTDVLCARLNDEPGELARVMGVMADCGINVTYSYSLISTYIALSVKDLARAEQLLAGEPVELIGQDDLARSLGPDGLAAACGEGR